MCLPTSCSWLHAIMVACEECSWPEVTGLGWYRWLELRSRWRRQQYSHFDTACQSPKGKLHFLFAVMIPPSAARYFRHLPAMSMKTTLHATAPLLYPCRRYSKCPWGLYASPPPVAMAVVGWFLCFPAFFSPFFGKNGVFFPYTTSGRKKSIRDLHQKKFPSNKNATYAKKKVDATYAKKTKKATDAYFHNRATLSSALCSSLPCLPGRGGSILAGPTSWGWGGGRGLHAATHQGPHTWVRACER